MFSRIRLKFFISISFSRPTILYIFAPKKKREEAN